MIFRGESSTTAVFLNAEPELVGRNALLVGSVVVSLLCMLLAFGIILILSKRAVDPYMRNIEQQKRFITDASHEIKTPLTAIAASADVLAMDLQENEWVENIRQQVQRLSKLVSNLVTLSRLDEEQPLPEQYTDLKPVQMLQVLSATFSISYSIPPAYDFLSIYYKSQCFYRVFTLIYFISFYICSIHFPSADKKQNPSCCFAPADKPYNSPANYKCQTPDYCNPFGCRFHFQIFFHASYFCYYRQESC